LERERLMNGDWSVQENGLIHAEWLRYYVEGGGQLELLSPDGRAVAIVGDNACHRFVTIDPAGTSQERTREAQGRTASWSVVQVWDQPPRELAKYLILRDQVRRRVGFNDLCALIRDVRARWQPERIWIEGEKLDVAVWEMLRGDMPIECLSTGCKDKATRAGPLILKLERGELFLPRHNTTWRMLLESELLTWTGDERQAADQIDAAAYAAIVAEKRVQRPIRVVLGAARS
jgi:phage terminase large subunit-like protein